MKRLLLAPYVGGVSSACRCGRRSRFGKARRGRRVLGFRYLNLTADPLSTVAGEQVLGRLRPPTAGFVVRELACRKRVP